MNDIKLGEFYHNLSWDSVDVIVVDFCMLAFNPSGQNLLHTCMIPTIAGK